MCILDILPNVQDIDFYTLHRFQELASLIIRDDDSYYAIQ
jgi:hypothetical protein